MTSKSAQPGTTAAPRRRIARHSHHTHRTTVRWLLLPSTLFLLIWMVVPLVMTLYYSFQTYNLMMPTDRGFGGVLNYTLMFIDPTFWDSLINTLVLVFSCLIVTLVFGLALALLYNRTFPLRGIARTLAITPFFVMPVVAGMIWKNMLMHPVYGLFSWFEKYLGFAPIDWFGDYPMVSIIIMISWMWIPFALLVLLTGLQSLPEDQLEAVRLDGANRWQEFRYIVLPHLSQVIYVVLMLESIFFLTSFAEIYTTTSGGPGTATTNLPYYIYLNAFFQYDIGFSSASAVAAVILANIFSIFLIRFVAGNLKAGAPS